jgi:putative exporter of polyketide antibiotics
MRLLMDQKEPLLISLSPNVQVLDTSRGTLNRSMPRPFGDLRFWPYLAIAALFLALFLSALRVCGRRDIGAGLVTPRPGPGTASTLLRGPVGLIWRITRGTSYGWGVGAAI